MQSPTQHDLTVYLPPEILVNIFSYLDVQDICHLSVVCSRWRGIIHAAENLWRLQCWKLRESKFIVINDRTLGFSWKDIFQRNYGNNAIKRQWRDGKCSNPRSYRDLPRKVMCTMDKDEWGEFFQSELDRF